VLFRSYTEKAKKLKEDIIKGIALTKEILATYSENKKVEKEDEQQQ
jgi:outer membrane protein assembly factor BamD